MPEALNAIHLSPTEQMSRYNNLETLIRESGIELIEQKEPGASPKLLHAMNQGSELALNAPNEMAQMPQLHLRVALSDGAHWFVGLVASNYRRKYFLIVDDNDEHEALTLRMLNIPSAKNQIFSEAEGIAWAKKLIALYLEAPHIGI